MASLKFKPDKVPLELFELSFKLMERIELNITKAGKLVSIVQDPYNSEPNILLIDDGQPNISISMNKGLVFTDSSTGNMLLIAKREIKFTFVQYYDWLTTTSMITPIIKEICKLFQVEEFKSVSMLYIDKFPIPKSGFDFNDYFTTKIEMPSFELDWNDFHLGIVPEDDECKKLVIRIRGRNGDKKNYHYFVDSVYSGKKSIPFGEEATFLNELTKIHDLLENYFCKILTNNFQKNLFSE